jgi:hypothetical protein
MARNSARATGGITNPRVSAIVQAAGDHYASPGISSPSPSRSHSLRTKATKDLGFAYRIERFGKT